MTSRSLRSPLLALVGAAGALTLVACSAADSSSMPIARHRTTASGGTASSGSQTSTGSGSGTGDTTSNGDTSSSGGSSGGGSSSGASSSGGSSGGASSSGSGSSGGSGTPQPPATPSFDLLVDNASPALKLADETVLQVTVTPTNGWSGPVTLSVAQLPSDVTAELDNANLTLGAAASTVKLTLKSVSSTNPVATPFSIVGTAGSTTHNAAATVTVKPDITIKIPVNIDAMNTGFGTINVTAPQDIANNPVAIHFLNLDSTPHEIHGGQSGEGFPHGTGTFGQNQEDKVRNVTKADTYNFYLHDEGGPQNPGKIVVSPPPQQ